MRRATLHGCLALAALGGLAPLRAQAATDTTFDSLEQSAVAVRAILESAARAKRDCSCLDEFEQRDCEKDARAAQIELDKKPLIAFDIGPQLTIKLARYDFKKGVFPAAIPGGRLVVDELPACEPKVSERERCSGTDLIGEPERAIAVVIKDPAWLGQLQIVDEALARSLRDDATAVTGQLLVRVEAVSLVKRENAALAAKKKALLAEIDAKLKPLVARHGEAALEDVVAKRACYARAPTQDLTLTISTAFGGVRLLTAVHDEYLVSEPRSARSLMSNRDLQAHAEVAQLEKERAQKAQAEEARRAAAAARPPISFLPSSLRVTLGGMDLDAVNNVVTDRVDDLVRCVAARPEQDSVLELVVFVDQEGNVAPADAKRMITSSTTKNAAIDQCIVRVVQTWRFPPPESGHGGIAMRFSLPGVVSSR